MYTAYFQHKAFLTFNKDPSVLKSDYRRICFLKNTEKDTNFLGMQYKSVMPPSVDRVKLEKVRMTGPSASV